MGGQPTARLPDTRDKSLAILSQAGLLGAASAPWDQPEGNLPLSPHPWFNSSLPKFSHPCPLRVPSGDALNKNLISSSQGHLPSEESRTCEWRVGFFTQLSELPFFLSFPPGGSSPTSTSLDKSHQPTQPPPTTVATKLRRYFSRAIHLDSWSSPFSSHWTRIGVALRKALTPAGAC